MFGPQVGAPSLSILIMVALCAQQVYPPILLYHWRGLTRVGLVLVHPNIIIYIMKDFIIGMGGNLVAFRQNALVGSIVDFTCDILIA